MTRQHTAPGERSQSSAQCGPGYCPVEPNVQVTFNDASATVACSQQQSDTFNTCTLSTWSEQVDASTNTLSFEPSLSSTVNSSRLCDSRHQLPASPLLPNINIPARSTNACNTSARQFFPSTALSGRPTVRTGSCYGRILWSNMGPVVPLVLLALTALLPHAAVADWDSNCPSKCKCNYVSNRKVANCDHADYTTVPSSLSPEIQELVLTNNNIMQIDKDEFLRAGLVNLQRLTLSNNRIAYVDKDAFSGLRILIELDLQHNRIDKLHPHTFTGMEKLRKLVLSSNQLTRLEANQFPPLYHLQSLKLDSCQINYIHNYAFINLPNITALELSSNALESIESSLFSQNHRLVSLELSNNPWNCDCRMRNFSYWMMRSESFKNTNWKCFSPARLKDAHWNDLTSEDFACDPKMEVTQEIVQVVVGSHSDLDCWATGDPTPSIQWVADKKMLSNMTQIGESTDHYTVLMKVNDSGVFSTLELGVYGDHHPTQYTCIASNPANTIQKTIKVVVGSGDPLDVIVQAGPNAFVLIGVGVALIVLVGLLIVLLICCWCRRRSLSMTPHSKLNGSAGEHGSVLVVAPGTSINPIGKPPRQYEKLPQKDIEMTQIGNSSIVDGNSGGGHKSYEELDYPSSHQATYGGSRVRLPPLQEEAVVGHLVSAPYLVNDAAPSPTLTLQSNITQITSSHYPDLLDNARVPRTISPTQMSYQSLAYPPLTQDWRFSYAQPSSSNEFGVLVVPEYARSPLGYCTPQHQRPGYVTLPRRPRAPSWSGVPNPNPHIVANPMLSPTLPIQETVYDTLGPRTTADGTSTTDLTRPGSRAALYEPFPPTGGVQTPTSPLALAAHYTSMAAHRHNSPRRALNYHANARPGSSQTLPRSTPNLLDDNSLSIPQYRPNRNTTLQDYGVGKGHQALLNSEIEPLIEDPTLGIPYESSNQYDLVNRNASPCLVNGDFSVNDNQQLASSGGQDSYSKDKERNKGNSSNKTGSQQQRPGDPMGRSLLSASPSVSPSDKSSSKTLNSSVSSSSSPVPTPTQILTAASASPHTDHQQLQPVGHSPSISPNINNNFYTLPGNNTGGFATNGYSGSAIPVSITNGSGGPTSPAPSLSSPTTAGPMYKKKIPPRPPPKPASKRLSVASVTSESSLSGTGRKPSFAGSDSCGLYQDEGPDGSEV